MSYPVILKKDNKPLKEFKTIKEMAEFIKWDYHLLYHYIKKDKRTDEGFTFKVNWVQVRETQKNFVKKLNKHNTYWHYAKRIHTARYHANEYLYYANQILCDPEAYKNTVIKMRPILLTKPFFKYIDSLCGLTDYNIKLAELKRQIAQVNTQDLVTIDHLRQRFKRVLEYITPEHLSEYITVEDGNISFKKAEIFKAPTLLLTKKERLSITCIKTLLEKLEQSQQNAMVEAKNLIK